MLTHSKGSEVGSNQLTLSCLITLSVKLTLKFSSGSRKNILCCRMVKWTTVSVQHFIQFMTYEFIKEDTIGEKVYMETFVITDLQETDSALDCTVVASTFIMGCL